MEHTARKIDLSGWGGGKYLLGLYSIYERHISRKLLYADDLAIVAEDKEMLNESLEEWKEAFKQHGLRVNLEKTEVLSIGAHREELNIKLEG